MELAYGKSLANTSLFQDFTGVPSIDSSLHIANLTLLTIDMNTLNPGDFWCILQIQIVTVIGTLGIGPESPKGVTSLDQSQGRQCR